MTELLIRGQGNLLILQCSLHLLIQILIVFQG